MTDVISFDSQDFLLQSDIDLLQSVEFEFPVQEDSDIPTEVTQIEIITAPTKRKRSTGVKKTQGSSGARRTTASSQYTTVPLPPCKVCGGVATGFHFGVITCEACKAFFRRALIHKQNYKCLKDNDCEIIDKKLGNCSACRLKKCFALGMSKGGVRRGRYSIAIRTKAIVEAKAMEGKHAAVMPTSGPIIKQEPKPEKQPSTDLGISLEELNGLLDITELDRHFNKSTPSPKMSPPKKSMIEAMIERNDELESLLDALMSCQEALYPQLRKLYGDTETLEAQHYEIYHNYTKKQEMFDEMFGTTDTLSTEEFQQIFAETGIDLDDRLVHFNKKGCEMEEYIAQFVNYAKIIPGFKSLNPKDVSKLLKGSHMEFWMFGNFPVMNSKLGVCGGYENKINSHKSDMAKFFGDEYTDKVLEFSDTMKKLAPTLEEISIMRVILITYTDRCQLQEPEKIQKLQDKFVECLQYHLTKTVSNPGRRLSQIFDRMLAIRDLTHQNNQANKKFLSEWGFVMQDFPLWKEMLSFDEV